MFKIGFLGPSPVRRHGLGTAGKHCRLLVPPGARGASQSMGSESRRPKIISEQKAIAIPCVLQGQSCACELLGRGGWPPAFARRLQASSAAAGRRHTSAFRAALTAHSCILLPCAAGSSGALHLWSCTEGKHLGDCQAWKITCVIEVIGKGGAAAQPSLTSAPKQRCWGLNFSCTL